MRALRHSRTPTSSALRATLPFCVSFFASSCGSRTPLSIEGTDGGASGDLGATLDPSCIVRAHETHGLTTDLYFLLDKSSSMNAVDSDSTTRWEAISTAMSQFVSSSDSAGLGAGVGFFPVAAGGSRTASSSASCETEVYSTPAVPMGTLPQAANDIKAAIVAQTLTRGTPTTPALRGAYAYATQRHEAVPDHEIAVVVVTDGLPTECDSTIENASAAASAAVAASPSIATYVLGVGSNLSNLNAIANAGGTEAAYLVETGGVRGLATALNAIRANTISCELSLAVADGPALDYDTATVGARIGTGGEAAELMRVADVSQCNDVDSGPASGRWYYDDVDSPKRIVLCSNVCRLLSDTPGSYLNICVKAASVDGDP